MNSPSTTSSKRLLLLVGVPVIIITLVLIIFMFTGRYISTDNAYIKADKVPISAEVSGNITAVYVNDNAPVKTGQPLYQIDDTAYKIALVRAQAKLLQTYNDIATLKASYSSKKAEIQLAKANHDYALQEQKRATNQSVSSFVPKIKQDALTHDTQISSKKIALLEDELKQIATAGGDTNIIIESHPLYLAAKAELEQAELNMQHIIVYASRNGIISKPPKIGQFITAGTISTMLVVNDSLWIEANLTETDLTHVKEGQSVSIKVDTYPGHEWQGQVESISPATGAEFSIIPAQNATGNWVKIAQRLTVRIKLLPETDTPILRSGLSAFIKIDTHYKRQLSDIHLSI